MKTRLCILMLLLSITVTALVHGQGEKKARTVDDYRPRTLKELRTLLPETFRSALVEREGDSNKDLRQIVHGELFPSRVKAVYNGEKRQLPDEKRNVIVSWANQFAGGTGVLYSALSNGTSFYRGRQEILVSGPKGIA